MEAADSPGVTPVHTTCHQRPSTNLDPAMRRSFFLPIRPPDPVRAISAGMPRGLRVTTRLQGVHVTEAMCHGPTTSHFSSGYIFATSRMAAAGAPASTTACASTVSTIRSPSAR